MRKVVAVTFILSSTALCILFVGTGAAAAERVEMLWNPGPDYLAGETLVNTGSNPNGCSTDGTTMVEAELVGNPANRFTSLPCTPTTVLGAPNGAAPSFYIDTRAGWTFANHDLYPGYAVWWESGGGGTPLQFAFLNHALYEPEPCSIRELGLSYVRWPYVPDSQFRSNSYRLGEFGQVDASFEARVPYEAGPPQCGSFPTGYVSADFHVAFVNPSGETVQSQLLGVLLYTQPGMSLPEAPQPVFWENGEGTEKILIGSRLSPAIPSMSPESGWQSYTINFKQLVESEVTPPLGYSIHEAVVSGLDVYTSVRGSDLDLQLRGVDIYGTR